MRHAAKPTCPVCESRGVEAYAALRDHLFGAPGSWRMVRCVNALCGIYWLDPAPLKEDLPVAYRGYYTHGHADAAERPNAFRAGVRNAYVARKLGYPAPNESISTKLCSYVAPFVARRGQAWLYAGFYLPGVDGGRLLEVGCGSGWQLDRMKELGWRVKGVDFDPQAAAAARARGLDVVIGDVRELNLEAGSFDAVVMAHVLEHVFDPVSLLAECRRLLKPGGRLISITPNGRSFGHRYYKAAWRGLEPPRHIAVFTVAGLHLACRRAGLDVERIDVTARDAANLLLASGRIRRIRGDAQVVRPSAAHAPPLTTRLLAVMERIGIALGFAIGEETVLTAVKPHRDER